MKFSLVLALLVLALTPFYSGCSTVDEPSSSSAQSSDKDIRRDVINRLRDDGITAQTPFGVQVDGGVVTLSGIVSSPTIRVRAVSIANGAPGVRDVVDELRQF